MAIAEVAIIPIGTKTTSLSKFVACAVKSLAGEKDLTCTPTCMATIIEGDLDKIFQAVKRAHQAVIDSGAKRVVTTLKIDDRRDKKATSKTKLESLKKAMGNYPWD